MKYSFILWGLVLFFFFSCGEILEENISKDQVYLVAPGDQLQTRIYAQHFIWQEVVGARTYHLQIAQPSFDSLQIMVLDTVLKTTHFDYSLSPGTYQWRVSAANAGYQTVYSTRSIEIFPANLSEQKVILNDPADGLLTNISSINFSWGTLFGAKNYEMEIDTAHFADTTQLVLHHIDNATHFTFDLPKDQNYQWRVRGLADTATSAWSVIRTLKLDTQEPAQVVLVSPANNASVSSPVNLSWQSISDASQYEIYLYASDSTAVTGFPKQLSTTNYSFSGGNIGDHFIWRVRAKDAVGNTGLFSSYRSFLVQ